MTSIQNKYQSILFALLAVVAVFFSITPISYAAESAIPNPKTINAAEAKDCKVSGSEKLSKDNCGIIAVIVGITNVLSALVGIVLVAVVTVGGIQYSAAGGNPAAVSAARKKIFNAVIALALFIFGFAFLQYLIPGGVF